MNCDFRVGPWTVNPALNTVSQNGATAHVEPKVMEVLVCLASHAGEPVSKDTILRAVWAGTFVSDDVLIRSISELRRVFQDDARDPRFIETIPKRGYRLVGPVVRPGDKSDPSKPSESTPPSPKPVYRRNLRWTIGISVAGALLGMLLLMNAVGLRERLLGGTPTVHSLAVLPLQNLSDDPKQEYFAEAMTDALITNLAQSETLKVVSRTTIDRYGHPDKPLPQIARELKVDAIVEGTVQRSGDRVRVTAQLIYGASDRHLWANSYERDLRDVLALQNELTSEIAEQIHTKLRDTNATLKSPRRVNPKALDAYVEAQFHIEQERGLQFHKDKQLAIYEEATEAVFYLDRAIQQDPDYVPAYVAYFAVLDSEVCPQLERLPKARSALRRVLELEEHNVPAHLAMARLLMQYDYDWAGAEKEYKRAIELDQRSADAHAEYAEYLANVGGGQLEFGYTPEAEKQLDLAQALDPAHDYFADAGQQRRGRTLDEQRQAVEQKSPNDPYALAVLAKNYAIAGKFKEAVEMYERCLTLYGWKDMADVMKRANARGGPRYALEEWMRASENYQKVNNTVTLVVPMAFTYSSLGNNDRAFAWLNKAVQQRSWILIYLKRDKVWDPLRSDPRFSALLQRVGLLE